jgi:hypothetical protein
MAHRSRFSRRGLGQMKEPSRLPVSSSKHKKHASLPSSHVVPMNTLPRLTTGLPVVGWPTSAAHLIFFVDSRSTSPALFSTPQSAQSGNLRSLVADILREGCPHHVGQSPPLTAPAPAARSTPVHRICILKHGRVGMSWSPVVYQSWKIRGTGGGARKPLSPRPGSLLYTGRRRLPCRTQGILWRAARCHTTFPRHGTSGTARRAVRLA